MRQSAPHHGYLYRRCTRHISSTNQDIETATREYEAVEDDEDPPTANSQGQSKVARVEVEYHIVYSGTYRVPMLCLQAWDDCACSVFSLTGPGCSSTSLALDIDGAPLSLVGLMSANLLRAGAHVPTLDVEREDAIFVEHDSPFPLLQQTEHPTTGDIVWSVHPCHVSTAVMEVLCADSVIGTGASDNLRWLEAWMMISDGIVDLSIGEIDRIGRAYQALSYQDTKSKLK